MKKIIKYLLIGIFGLIFIPNIVNAENIVKAVNDKVYVIDKIDDYICDQGQGLKVFRAYKSNIIFYEPNSYPNDLEGEILKYLQSEELLPLYKYNLADNKCSKMSEKEKYDMYNDLYYSRTIGIYGDTITVSYEWDKDNKVYQVQTVNNPVQVYVKTKDTTVNSEKTYYYYSDREYIEIDLDNPPEDLTIEDYFEKRYYVENPWPFSEDTDYYTSSSYESVHTANKITDFKDLTVPYFGILMDEEDLVKKIYILTADFDKFVKTPVSGVTFTKDNIKEVVNIDGTNYLLMSEGEVSFLYTADGNPVKYNKSDSLMQFIALMKYDDVYFKYTEDLDAADDLSQIISLIDDNFNVVNVFALTLQEFEENTIIYSATSYSNYKLIYIGNDKFVKVTIYGLIEGANQKYDNNNLVFRFSGDLANLTKVKINGTDLNNNNYTATSGSTIITLKKDYLKTLKAGTYTLKVEYNDGGYVSTTFAVGEANPQTFDEIMIYITLGIVSLIGIAGIVIYTNKRKI